MNNLSPGIKEELLKMRLLIRKLEEGEGFDHDHDIYRKLVESRTILERLVR